MPYTARNKWNGLVQIIHPELPLAAGLCVVIGELPTLPATSRPGGFSCPFCSAEAK